MAERIKTPGTDKPPRGEKPPRAKRAADASGGGTGASARRGGSSSTPAAAAPPRKAPTGQDAKLHAALVQMYAGVGIGVQGIAMMGGGDVGLAVSGANILSMAESTADAWIELAQQNPKVRATLEGLVTGSAVATLVGCHASMVVPVLASRGVVPGQVANMFLTDDAKTYAAHLAEQQRAAAAAAAQNGTAPPA